MDAVNQLFQTMNLENFLYNSNEATRNDDTWTEANIQAAIKHEKATIKNFVNDVFKFLNNENAVEKRNEVNAFIDRNLSNITNAIELKTSLFNIRGELVLLVKQLGKKALLDLHEQFSRLDSAVIKGALHLGDLHSQCEKYFEKGSPPDVAEDDHLLYLAHNLASHRDPSKAVQIFKRILNKSNRTSQVGNHILNCFRYGERLDEAFDFINKTHLIWDFTLSLGKLTQAFTKKEGFQSTMEMLKKYTEIKDILCSDQRLIECFERVLKFGNIENAHEIVPYLPSAIFEEKILGLPKAKIA